MGLVPRGLHPRVQLDENDERARESDQKVCVDSIDVRKSVEGVQLKRAEDIYVRKSGS
jgi:hypothetical protein